MKSIDPVLFDILEEAEVDYEFLHGAKHIHLRIGRALVLVLPKSPSKETAKKGLYNARARLKRFLKNLK